MLGPGLLPCLLLVLLGRATCRVTETPPSVFLKGGKGGEDPSTHSKFLLFQIKTVTFVSTGQVGIVAAVAIFIQKENVLDLVPVYVFCSQKVIGD